MKRYFGLIVAIVALGAIGVFGVRKYRTLETGSKRDAFSHRLVSQWFERSPWVNSIPDPIAYQGEVKNLLVWYFKEVEDGRTQFGGSPKFDDYLAELQAKAANVPKGMTSAEKDSQRKAVYEFTKKSFDLLRSKSYAPFWTGTDRGIRLDILSADTATIGGSQKIFMPLILWGFPRASRVDDEGVLTEKSSAVFRFEWKLYDAKDKLIATMPGEGGPDNRVDWPERYISQFPPGLLLGSYAIDLLPKEVKRIEISFDISGQAMTGGSVLVHYEWKLEAPAAWKLREGQSWEGATEATRSEEEINPKASETK